MWKGLQCIRGARASDAGRALPRAVLFRASMRPRRARLGCAASPLPSAATINCFNEAEARAPRMPGACCARPSARNRIASMRPRRARLGCGPHSCDARIQRLRFNEAEARAPRMHAGNAGGDQRDVRPSMRPRRARLGCSRHLKDLRLIRRRFNEAEARAPRMRRSAAVLWRKRHQTKIRQTWQDRHMIGRSVR